MSKSIPNDRLAGSRPWIAICRFLVPIAALCLPDTVLAHAFGQRYDLPLPYSMYLWSGGYIVAASFIIAAALTNIVPPTGYLARLDFRLFPSWPVSFTAAVTAGLKTCSLLLFALVLVSGFAGPTDPASNFAPIFVWIIWWVGMAYVSALAGNFWDLVNPWRILYDFCRKLFGWKAVPARELPAWIGAWPALGLLFAFVWFEFISGYSEHPELLAWAIVAYTLLTLGGMRLYGESKWLECAEISSLAFGLMAKFAILRVSPDTPRRFELRFPGRGLLADRPLSPSMTLFTLLMLAAVSFDGFVETPLWIDWSTRLESGLRELLPGMPAVQGTILTLGLIVFYLLLSASYLLSCLLDDRITGRKQPMMKTAGTYVLALVPIAIAYHLAHYYSYLLVAGQLVIPVMSDPLSLGWDLFGTAGYRLDISVFNAAGVWDLSRYAIVIGHIFAVWIAHLTALRVEPDAGLAILGQLPMLILMIAYTMISLWILSQPIVS